MDARLGEQSDVVQNALANRAPSRASRSRLGVFRNVFPAQPIASHRWSSVKMTTTFGRAPGARAGSAHPSRSRIRISLLIPIRDGAGNSPSRIFDLESLTA